jgi:hypothetical protein
MFKNWMKSQIYSIYASKDASSDGVFPPLPIRMMNMLNVYLRWVMTLFFIRGSIFYQLSEFYVRIIFQCPGTLSTWNNDRGSLFYTGQLTKLNRPHRIIDKTRDRETNKMEGTIVGQGQVESYITTSSGDLLWPSTVCFMIKKWFKYIIKLYRKGDYN